MTVPTRNQHGAPRPQEADTPHAAPARKAFVEPTISSPVDVLEATTYFQVVESGGTGARRRPPT